MPNAIDEMPKRIFSVHVLVALSNGTWWSVWTKVRANGHQAATFSAEQRVRATMPIQPAEVSIVVAVQTIEGEHEDA